MAAGPWGSRPSRPVGASVPLVATRHAVVVLERPPDWSDPATVWLDIAHGWYYKPEGPRGLLVGGMPIDAERSVDPDAYTEAPTFDEIEEHAAAAVARFPILSHAVARGGWAGVYDVTPDGQPVIDVVDDVPGLVLAFGFSGHGFKLAPAVGLAVSQLVTDGKCAAYDLRPLRRTRFEEAAATRGAYAYSIVG